MRCDVTLSRTVTFFVVTREARSTHARVGTTGVNTVSVGVTLYQINLDTFVDVCNVMARIFMATLV